MPFDGVALSGVIYELNEKIMNGRVDKITQPEADEIVMTIRGMGVNHKLLLSANASSPRIHFTAENKTSPLQAPMFCMLLRKHLSGGRIVKIHQPDFERIAALFIESNDELGDRSVKRLVIEIMGKHSNILLLDSQDIILDAAKHISHDVSTVREVLPGKAYSRPPSGDKCSPLGVDALLFDEVLARENKQGLKIQQAVYQSFNGISPIMASEICLSAGIAPEDFTLTLDEAARKRLHRAFEGTFVKTGRDFSCQIYFDATQKPIDFSALPLDHVYSGLRTENYESPSEMLEKYYGQRDTVYRLSQKTADLRKLVAGQVERCVKKRALYDKTLTDIANRDQLRVYGELLTAYIHLVKSGSESFSAENFYNEGEIVEIPLDTALSAAENAQVYFKQYSKQKRTFAALQEQIKQNEEDLAYLESVSAGIQAVTEESDITDLRTELAGQGFVKKKRDVRSKAQKKSKPLHYISSDGFDIYVGKNNLQNDELTLRFAQNGDIWMHTKDIAGSHVIIRCGGETPPERTLGEAANLAAFYSKGRGSSQVPVDYVIKKHVRKPVGAKPGFVIYDHHKTAYVTPVETELQAGL